MSTATSTRKVQLSGKVVSYLMEWLSSGGISVGERLPPEREIMKMMGVGRSTIREAIKILEHQGILDVRIGDGTYLTAAPQFAESFLSRLKRADIDEVEQLKLSFEMQIAYLASIRKDDADILSIEKALLACEIADTAGNVHEFVNSDFLFHKEIALAAKTTLLYDIYITIREVVKDLEFEPAQNPLSRKRALLLHKQLFEAIKSGNASAARDLWLLRG